MARFKVKAGDSRQYLTKAKVKRRELDRARKHQSAGEGPGWV